MPSTTSASHMMASTCSLFMLSMLADCSRLAIFLSVSCPVKGNSESGSSWVVSSASSRSCCLHRSMMYFSMSVAIVSMMAFLMVVRRVECTVSLICRYMMRPNLGERSERESRGLSC